MLKKIWLHFKLITKHRWIVFKLCTRVGLPWRGLIHDLSKYGPTEFWESAKYYVGYKSPIQIAREKREYSAAWLHHKGHNKHHEEYWYDFNAPVKVPVIPYKYTICIEYFYICKFNLVQRGFMKSPLNQLVYCLKTSFYYKFCVLNKS